MSFQGYLWTIAEKTGRDVTGLRDWADAKGVSEGGKLRPDVKARQVLALAKNELGLGRCHSTAVYALLSGKKDEHSK